jgi:3-methyladenine DNA glycosylase/8-oxoguanine DNA glycosylase
MYSRAKLHFKYADPVLFRAAKIHKIADIRRSSDVFGDLVHAIVNQQLSGKAAETIFGRLKVLAGKSGVTSKAMTKLKTSSMRTCGLSAAKVKSIKGLAKSVVHKEIDLVEIHKHDDEKVVELLTSIKGIGPWTAEMILMFSLGRQDIFSKGDLGLRKGIMHLYNLKKLPSDRTMDKLARAWSPYRTYAARVLWRVADGQKGTW